MSKKSNQLVTGVATLAAPAIHAPVVPVRDRHLRFNERWNYSPAPEVHTDITIKPRYDLFIGGKFVKPSSGKYFPSI
ncbi:MAG: betaine-aldehyde dehydrogenase, partial [Chthoniobacterales bacterium]